MKIREILQKLSSTKKRRREDVADPLVAYCRALLIPHFNSDTAPEIPFPQVEKNVYDVEGNGTYTMLEIRNGTFDLF